MDHLAGGATGAVASNVPAGSTESHGRVGLVDRGHHFGAHVDEGTGEVVGQWCGVGRLPRALVFCIGCGEAPPRCIGSCVAFRGLVYLGLGSLGLVDHKEGA